MDNGTRFRYIFRSAEKEAMKKFGATLSSLNVTPNQSEVLLVLYENEPVSLKELGELLNAKAAACGLFFDKVLGQYTAALAKKEGK